MLRLSIRLVALLAVTAAIVLPVTLCPLVQAFDVDVNGPLGYVALIGTIFATYIAYNCVTGAIFARNNGSLTIHPAVYVVVRVLMFELFAGSLLLLEYLAPSALTINSAAGLAIVYGALGLAIGLTDLTDAYIKAKFAEKDEKAAAQSTNDK